MMAEQIPLNLPSPVPLSRDNYAVSDANALAFQTVEHWTDWPQGKLVLTGDPGTGKTHLAHVWAQNAGAQVIDAAQIDMETWQPAPTAIDNIDRLAGDKQAETGLFHLHNLCLAEGHPLLMTTRIAPNRMPFVLPDLASRLGATAIATLDPPDDMLRAAMLVKLFADRHISAGPKLLDYALPRLDRTASALQGFVAGMERLAEKNGRKINRQLAIDLLAVTGQSSG